jgi:molybdopterin-binding protein
MSTSIQNRLPGKVVLEIVIRTAAGNVTSIIKTGSVKRMDFKEADTVFTTIKATEVCIERNRSFFVLPRSGAVGWITGRSDRAVT